MKTKLVFLFILFAHICFGQEFNVEKERIPGIKKLIIRYYNSGCIMTKGYHAIYTFDKNGRAIKSSNYFRLKHLESNMYQYNDKGLLAQTEKTFDCNKHGSLNTISNSYEFDKLDRVIIKTDACDTAWKFIYSYQDFDKNDNPQIIYTIYLKDTLYITKLKYNLQNRIILKQTFVKGALKYREEMKYDKYNNIIYSYIPTYLDKKTGKMIELLGGNRHAVTEEYEYIYDDKNRWIEKYVIYDNKKVLIEERKYK